jgi:hypothetical protein
MNDFKKTKEAFFDTHGHNSRILESCLFLLIVLIEAGIFIYLIHERRIVGGHDGFQYFTIPYYFLNNVVNYGEIPQWSPFMTQGTFGAIGYVPFNGIFQNMLFLSACLFKNGNFLPLFYAGIFFDELVLLTGVWLLGRRFFASPFTVFFVTLSIMGSCIWMLQPWWNFHIYYAIPLILYFIHTFLDSGKWRYYFLAGNLLFIQCLGNLPYILPVTTLVIFLYFILYFAFNFNDALQKIKSIKFGWSFIFISLFIILIFIALYTVMDVGDQFVNLSQRNPDGSSTLDIFLTYGGKFNWSSWLEIFLRLSPCLDYTLYMGIMCVPFILLGFIFNLNRRNIHFLLVIIVLLLFSMGTSVSVFFYYSWPMMKYFRHLMLVSPIIKVFLCFLAGFGFDALFFDKSRWKENPITLNKVFVFMSMLMLGLLSFSLIISDYVQLGTSFIRSMRPEKLAFFRTTFNENILNHLLQCTSFFALIFFILFIVLIFINRKKHLLPLVILFLGLHCADIYGFKFSEISFKTVPLNNQLYQITKFQSMPYSTRRDVSFRENSPRAKLMKVLPFQVPGTFNWSIYTFLFMDNLASSFRTEFCLLPLDNYMRAYWGQTIHDSSIRLKGLSHNNFNMDFPQGHSAILKISGVTEDKIQFFSGADFVSSDDDIASIITDPNYKGDSIFLSARGNIEDINTLNASGLSKDDLASNKRLHLPYQVQRFDANHLEVTTDAGDLKSSWLFYSDVWHPLWRATVNGNETPVYIANLAYKAVKLEPGLNKVHFYFKSKLLSVLYFIFGLNALCWLIIIFYLTGKIVFHHRTVVTNVQKPG